MRFFRNGLICACFLSILILSSAGSLAVPKEKAVLDAMEKATDFMMNTVSNRGGLLWKYSADLSDQWGEMPARKSMIWVQDPGTVGNGMMLLEAYKVTGDPLYLNYAKKAANALIWGQHPSGGWHYFIDFDMTGVRKFYDDVLSNCWGAGEYYHYYGNCTFDDNVTTGATRFLMELYMMTLDPAYRSPLIKALDFVLDSQYPNGAWPQRYPLSHEFPHHGVPDYTSYYTFNDNVIQGNIYLLLEAWEKLGNEEYKKAALRGMDFCIVAQLPPPQAGWGQQYNMNLETVQAREYEPASVMPSYTARIVRDLMTFYTITGDRRYLKGIPDAIEWIENSYLPEDHKMNDQVTHATFYELGTNKPLYAHREGTNMQNGRYWIDYEPRNFPGHYGMQTRINIEPIKKEYERINALTPEEAMAEYQSIRSRPESSRKVDPERVTTIIKSMDDRGTWVEPVRVHFCKDIKEYPSTEILGISTRTYLLNMQTMINYIRNLKDKK